MRIVVLIVVCGSAGACASKAQSARTPHQEQGEEYALRVWGAAGVGGHGSALGAGGAAEHDVIDRLALGVVGGVMGTSSITLGPTSSTTFGFGGVNARWGPFRTLRERGSHWTVSLATGLGYARHSWQEGDCDFALFDDGVATPPCETMGRSGLGAYVGTTVGWLYSFGVFGLALDARLDAVVGAVNGAAVTLAMGPKFAW